MNQRTPETPAAQVAIDELSAEAKTPEEQKILDSWQKELEEERKAFFEGVANATLPELVQLPDGSITTKEAAEKEVKNGTPSKGAYDSGRRA